MCDKKWIKVNYLSDGQYSPEKNIRFKTQMLRSDLCDFSDAYIVVKRAINLKNDEYGDMSRKDIAIKRKAPFKPCIKCIANV